MIHLPKQMKHLKKSSTDTDMFLNDDTCITIKENEEKEKTMELHEEEDVNEVNIVNLID